MKQQLLFAAVVAAFLSVQAYAETARVTIHVVNAYPGRVTGQASTSGVEAQWYDFNFGQNAVLKYEFQFDPKYRVYFNAYAHAPRDRNYQPFEGACEANFFIPRLRGGYEQALYMRITGKPWDQNPNILVPVCTLSTARTIERN